MGHTLHPEDALQPSALCYTGLQVQYITVPRECKASSHHDPLPTIPTKVEEILKENIILQFSFKLFKSF